MKTGGLGMERPCNIIISLHRKKTSSSWSILLTRSMVHACERLSIKIFSTSSAFWASYTHHILLPLHMSTNVSWHTSQEIEDSVGAKFR